MAAGLTWWCVYWLDGRFVLGKWPPGADQAETIAEGDSIEELKPHVPADTKWYPRSQKDDPSVMGSWVGWVD